jgi:ankyrin repeat protein
MKKLLIIFGFTSAALLLLIFFVINGFSNSRLVQCASGVNPVLLSANVCLMYLKNHGLNDDIDSDENDVNLEFILNGSSSGKFEIADFFIKNKLLSVNEIIDSSEIENRPLHSAVIVGDSESVQYLLQHGADVSFKNKIGKTPLDLAKESLGNPELRNMPIIIDLLENEGLN